MRPTMPVFAILCLLGSAAGAAPHELVVPLRDGKVRVSEVIGALPAGWPVPQALRALEQREIDVRGLGGSVLVGGINRALGDGCRVSVSGAALVLHVDPAKLPRNPEQVKTAARNLTAALAPAATARQERQWGLQLPADFDENRSVVVLIHGLDTTSGFWASMATALQRDRYAVGYYSYPNDGPIADSAAALARQIAAARQQHPKLRLAIIAHSMGGLVARAAVEGPDYPGGVEKLILIATPNHGSTWARFHLAREIREFSDQRRYNPDWRWTWMITDGLGEGPRDMNPNSPFLQQLNARPRRADVAYTIIAGDRNALSDAAKYLGQWGQTRTGQWTARAAATAAKFCAGPPGDGPVTLDSARLDGVDDVVILHADHIGLCVGDGTNPPAAWETIKARLAR